MEAGGIMAEVAGRDIWVGGKEKLFTGGFVGYLYFVSTYTTWK